MAAKRVDTDRPQATSAEQKPWSGRCDDTDRHPKSAYGSEGRGFESLRQRWNLALRPQDDGGFAGGAQRSLKVREKRREGIRHPIDRGECQRVGKRPGSFQAQRPHVDEHRAGLGGTTVTPSYDVCRHEPTITHSGVCQLGVTELRVSTGAVAKSIHSPEYAVMLALLRQLREDAGLRQVDLAARLGRLQTFVSKVETGERRLDVLELRAICRELGTDLPAFVGQLEAELTKLHPKRSQAPRRV